MVWRRSPLGGSESPLEVGRNLLELVVQEILSAGQGRQVHPSMSLLFLLATQARDKGGRGGLFPRGTVATQGIAALRRVFLLLAGRLRGDPPWTLSTQPSPIGGGVVHEQCLGRRGRAIVELRDRRPLLRTIKRQLPYPLRGGGSSGLECRPLPIGTLGRGLDT